MSQLAQVRYSVPTIPERQSRLTTVLWWTMLVLSLGVVAYATSYFLSLEKLLGGRMRPPVRLKAIPA